MCVVNVDVKPRLGEKNCLYELSTANNNWQQIDSAGITLTAPIYTWVKWSNWEYEKAPCPRTDATCWSRCQYTLINETICCTIFIARSVILVVPFLTGSYSYKFTAPGMYYYSSGPVNQDGSLHMKGMVRVSPKESFARKLAVFVGGYEALHDTSAGKWVLLIWG